MGTTYTARIQGVLVGDVESSSSPITLSFSDDDYGSYTTWGTLDLSQQRRIATRLGSSRKRAYVLTHAAATPMRLEALEFPELAVN
jgi:hypothetical protein